MSIWVNDMKVAFSPRRIHGWLRYPDTRTYKPFVDQIHVIDEYHGASPASRRRKRKRRRSRGGRGSLPFHVELEIDMQSIVQLCNGRFCAVCRKYWRGEGLHESECAAVEVA